MSGEWLGRYVADVLSDFRTAKANSKEVVQSKLLFKKRMFRETDESITEAMFINLSYVQVSRDRTHRISLDSPSSLHHHHRLAYRLYCRECIYRDDLDSLTMSSLCTTTS